MTNRLWPQNGDFVPRLLPRKQILERSSELSSHYLVSVSALQEMKKKQRRKDLAVVAKAFSRVT